MSEALVLDGQGLEKQTPKQERRLWLVPGETQSERLSRLSSELIEANQKIISAARMIGRRMISDMQVPVAETYVLSFASGQDMQALKLPDMLKRLQPGTIERLPYDDLSEETRLELAWATKRLTQVDSAIALRVLKSLFNDYSNDVRSAVATDVASHITLFDVGVATKIDSMLVDAEYRDDGN